MCPNTPTSSFGMTCMTGAMNVTPHPVTSAPLPKTQVDPFIAWVAKSNKNKNLHFA